MKKRVAYAVVFLVAVSVGVVVFVFSKRGHQDNVPEIAIVTHSSESKYNRVVRSEIQENALNFIDSHGINTSLSASYDANTPLVEILCKIRDLAGTIRPVKVRSLYIVGDDGMGGSYGVRGLGFRTELGRERGGIYRLLYGMEYRVVAAYEPDDNLGNVVHAKESATSFTTPDSLRPGEILSVELVVVDKIREQEELAKEEGLKRQAAEQTITVLLAEPPKYAFPGAWGLLYHDGTKKYGLHRAEAETFVLPGPKKLGGELMAYYHGAGQDRTWAYIREVKRRAIELPKGAGRIIKPEDLIEVGVQFEKESEKVVLKGVEAVAFYADKEAKLPLFWVRVPEDLQGQNDNSSKLEPLKVLMVPGTYSARLIKSNPQETAMGLGKIEIADTPKRIYTLTIP